MPTLTDIIGMRRLPGVIILDAAGTVLFVNESVSCSGPVFLRAGTEGQLTVPAEVRSLCEQVRAASEGGDAGSSSAIFYNTDGFPYSLRAFPMAGAQEGESSPRHIMVLIEPVTERRQVNYEAVRQEYGISNRQLDVLKLICLGLSNREIAERLYISEHTAKDHTRSILQAFQASSRSEVIAVLNG